MKLLWFLFFILVSYHGSSASSGGSSSRRDPMAAYLDAVQTMMTGEKQFDRSLYSKIKTCLKSTGRHTDVVQNMIFRGNIDYWATRGAENDRWGSYESGYIENNKTVTKLFGMEVLEPCNTASNIAYHHTLLELCNSQKQGKLSCLGDRALPALRALAYLMPSSCFYHSSSTNIGISLDLKAIDIITYLLHQASVAALPYDPVVHDLSKTKRRKNSIELANNLEIMYAKYRVNDWNKTLAAIDIPSRYLSIGALVATSVSLSINPFIVRMGAKFALSAFNLDSDEADFIVNEYIPRISKLYSKLPRSKRSYLRKHTVSSLSKLGYAFLWFSNFGTDVSRSSFSSLLNFIGSNAIPLINSNFNKMSSYTYNFNNLQKGKDLFPGEQKCNARYPHTKWHVQSAIAMIDAYTLTNDICTAIKDHA